MNDNDHDKGPSPAPVIDLGKPWALVATWFGCGMLRPAPGTWGTLGGLPLALVLVWFGGPLLLALASVAVIPLGLWAAEKFGRETRTHDSSSIVIDEVAGIWITLIPAGLDPMLWVAGFLLFRLLDVLKPGPVGWADKKLAGGFGVMADDVIAGAISAAIIAVADYALNGRIF